MTQKQFAEIPKREGEVIRRSDFVYQSLFREILAGMLPPGTRLREQELSKRLGISRTPVREALNRLVIDGVLQSVPNAGVLVKRYSLEDLRDLCLLRAAFECLAIRMACDKGFSESAIQSLGAANDELEEAIERDDDQGCYAADTKFHERLIDVAGSAMVKSAHNRSNIAIVSWRRAGESRGGDDERHRNALREHRSIVQALARRDSPTAQQRCEDHIMEGYRRTREYYAEHAAEEKPKRSPVRRKSGARS